MDKLYGRKWELIFTNDSFGSITISQENMSTPTLRMTFDVNYPGWKGTYLADIFIWNLKSATLNKLLIGQVEGTKVVLSAGYQEPSKQYGKIFEGAVYQCLFVRENAVDYRLQLRCIDGFDYQMSNWCMFNLDKAYTTQILANAINQYSQNPIKIGKLPDDIKETKAVRPVVGFDHPRKIAELFAKDRNCRSFVVNDELQFVTPTEARDPVPVQISPKTGLIGTPQQFDYGIIIRCLLNPKIALRKPLRSIQLVDKEVGISLTAVQPGRLNTIPLPLGQAPTSEANKWKEGFYQIGMVRYSGDTRGNDWYVEAHCFTEGGASGLLMDGSIPAANRGV